MIRSSSPRLAPLTDSFIAKAALEAVSSPLRPTPRLDPKLWPSTRGGAFLFQFKESLGNKNVGTTKIVIFPGFKFLVVYKRSVYGTTVGNLETIHAGILACPMGENTNNPSQQFMVAENREQANALTRRTTYLG